MALPNASISMGDREGAEKIARRKPSGGTLSMGGPVVAATSPPAHCEIDFDFGALETGGKLLAMCADPTLRPEYRVFLYRLASERVEEQRRLAQIDMGKDLHPIAQRNQLIRDLDVELQSGVVPIKSRRRRCQLISDLMQRAARVSNPRDERIAFVKKIVELNGGKALGEKQIGNVIK